MFHSSQESIGVKEVASSVENSVLLKINWSEYLIARLIGLKIVLITRINDREAKFGSLKFPSIDLLGFEALCRLSFGYCHLMSAKT